MESTETILLAIKKMFNKEHFEIKIISDDTFDKYIGKDIPQSYSSYLIFIDENGKEHETCFVKEKNTIPIHINSSDLPLCGCDVSASGRTIKSSLNKLYKLCKKMVIHKYGLYSNQ